jgi:hypothetical protein
MRPNQLRALGALTILVLALGLIALPADATDVCPGLDSGKIDTTGDPATVTVTAPDGFLIDSYCVKAGPGFVIINVDPPAETVVIDHPTKDSVSHYSLSYVEDTSSTTTTQDTTTTIGQESSTTTTPEETTTTAEPSPPTTPTTSTLPTPTTSTSAPTTTVPTIARWSAEATCDTLAVEFGEDIIAVTVWDGVIVLDEFLESGERTITVGAPLTLEVIPVTNPGIIADPESRSFTFRPCTEPTLTIPEEPVDPSVITEPPRKELPFTGVDAGALAVIALGALGLGTLIVRSWGDAEVD